MRRGIWSYRASRSLFYFGAARTGPVSERLIGLRIYSIELSVGYGKAIIIVVNVDDRPAECTGDVEAGGIPAGDGNDQVTESGSS